MQNMGIRDLKEGSQPVHKPSGQSGTPFTNVKSADSSCPCEMEVWLLMKQTRQMRPRRIPPTLCTSTDEEQAEPKHGNNQRWDKRRH